MNFKYLLEFNQDNEWEMDKHHFHENMEILLSLSDAGSFFADGNLYSLNRGTLIILQNTMLHKTIAHNCELYQRYVLHFSNDELKKISTAQTDLLSAIGKHIQCIQLTEDELDSLVEHFEKCRTYDCSSFGCDLRKSMAFIELLLKICTYTNNKESINSSDDNGFSKISPILKHISDNLNEELSLNLLSEKFYMNKFHLSRIFKSVTGFTLMKYIINCRVLKAKELLRHGYSVQEAGELAGFNNNSHFIRTFGKYTGLSPGKYMKEYRKSKNDRKF